MLLTFDLVAFLFYFFATVDPQCQDNDPYKCPWLTAKKPSVCSWVLKCECEIQGLNKGGFRNIYLWKKKKITSQP